MGTSATPEDKALAAYAGDPPVRWLLDRLGLRPAAAALLTFALGIGVMGSWYLLLRRVGDPAARLKGQFDYFATYADALTLPALGAIVVAGYRGSGDLFAPAIGAERQRLAAALAAPGWTALTAAGVLGGLASFYLVPATRWEVNWTSPVIGRLNAPGWYHAGFMALELYLILGFTIRSAVVAALGWGAPHLVAARRAAWCRHAALLAWFATVAGCFSGFILADRVHGGLLAANQPLALLREPTLLGVYATGLPLCAATRLLASRGELVGATLLGETARPVAAPPLVLALTLGLHARLTGG